MNPGHKLYFEIGTFITSDRGSNHSGTVLSLDFNNVCKIWRRHAAGAPENSFIHRQQLLSSPPRCVETEDLKKLFNNYSLRIHRSFNQSTDLASILNRVFSAKQILQNHFYVTWFGNTNLQKVNNSLLHGRPHHHVFFPWEFLFSMTFWLLRWSLRSRHFFSYSLAWSARIGSVQVPPPRSEAQFLSWPKITGCEKPQLRRGARHDRDLGPGSHNCDPRTLHHASIPLTSW